MVETLPIWQECEPQKGLCYPFWHLRGLPNSCNPHRVLGGGVALPLQIRNRGSEKAQGCRQGRCQAYHLAGEWFSLHPPCLQDTSSNLLTCTHFRPLPSACHACKGRADSRCLRLEEQSVKESWASQFTAVPPSSSSRWHWLAFLLAGPFAARDVQLDSLALSQEHFPTLHCLY